MDEPATAETIIHALSQFRPDDQDHAHDIIGDAGAGAGTGAGDAGGDDAAGNEIDNAPDQMSRIELEAEVLRLRGVLHGDSSRSSSRPASLSPLLPNTAPGAKRPRERAPKGIGSKPKTEDTPVRLQVATGKRVEKDRKTELYKAIRHTMRQTMGMIHESDRLPAPTTVADVPDWLDPSAARSEEWVARIATKLHQDLTQPAGAGQQSEVSFSTAFPKVNDEDKAYEVILEACRVTFANYVKRYKSENDDTHAARKARYARNRRRWARKDLKQERRAKARAGLDPSHPLTGMDQDALHFDYQSSEYSSPGEDSSDEDAEAGGYHAEKVRRRAEIWECMRQGAGAGPSRLASAGSGEYGWAPGLGAKVLEIRTPSWRSQRLNELYAELDSIAALASQQRNTPRSIIKPPAGTSSGGVKSGHVAPSHHRFTMPSELRRKGGVPRQPGSALKTKKKRPLTADKGQDEGEVVESGALGAGDDGMEKGWMWASGTVGVWPPLVPL